MRHVTILAEQLEQALQLPTNGLIGRNLKKYLSRAIHVATPHHSTRQTLFDLFGLSINTGSAPFNMLADGLNPGSTHCIHADPVSLYVDVARVFITRWGAPGLSETDLQALPFKLAEHFESEGLILHTPGPDRWYITGAHEAHIDFPPPEEVMGRDMGEVLPTGADAVFWKTRLNESQMILHRNTVNDQLIALGNPAINSLWFWGGGTLPNNSSGDGAPALCGKSALIRGLACWSGVPIVNKCEDLLETEAFESVCIELSDPAGQPETFLNELDQTISSLLTSLKNGDLETISIRGRSHSFDLDRRDWRAFWRRRTLQKSLSGTS